MINFKNIYNMLVDICPFGTVDRCRTRSNCEFKDINSKCKLNLLLVKGPWIYIVCPVHVCLSVRLSVTCLSHMIVLTLPSESDYQLTQGRQRAQLSRLLLSDERHLSASLAAVVM